MCSYKNPERFFKKIIIFTFLECFVYKNTYKDAQAKPSLLTTDLQAMSYGVSFQTQFYNLSSVNIMTHKDSCVAVSFDMNYSDIVKSLSWNI